MAQKTLHRNDPAVQSVFAGTREENELPATHYKVWAFGTSVGQGIAASIHVGVAGVAKEADAGLPFMVANELIAYNLARAVLVPAPPGFIIEKNGASCFVSLNFNLAGHDLPPVNPQLVVKELPELSAGIIVFDAWIVNPDRHRSNIAYYQATRQLQIFDHASAFFCGKDAASARSFLESKKDSLGIGAHCLAAHVEDLSGMQEWIRRVKTVADFYIEEVVKAAVNVGLPRTEADFCSGYLKDRRDGLEQLVSGNVNCFPRVRQGSAAFLNGGLS